MTYLAIALVAVVVGIAVGSICLAWGQQPATSATRPTSSSRKSGRVRTGGA